MPTYTFLGQTPNDGTYEVGTGPFKDLPAGTYKGNFYGNDPRLGIIQAGEPRYSLPDSPEDASSSGNTFQVGTGPQPNLPAGRFLLEDIQAFLRDQARLARAEAAAAQPQPPQINFAAPTAAPVQTTLPSPVAPVAVPSFVPGGSAPSTVFSSGTPNIGVDNLLAIGAAQASGAPGAAGAIGASGIPGIPGFVSPLQSLLPPSSTLPATGSNTLAAPNLTSSIPASVFSQLFPSVPDISQQPTAMAANGGPILASDSLPRYQVGGDVDPGGPDVPNEFSAFRQFQGANMGTDPYYADDQLLEGFLNDGFTLEEIFGPGWTDRHNRYTGRPLPNMAHGGPILASDFLPGYQNAGDVNAELEARRPEIMTGLREFFVERGRYTDKQFLAEFGKMPTKDLLREFMAQKKADERFGDRFPSLRGLSSPEPSPDAPPETPSLRAPYEIPKNYYPPEYEFLEEGPTELDYDMRLPEQFQNPSHTVPSFPPGPLGVRQAANGGPILASEYLNAGGPVRYFENGGAVGAGFRPSAPPGDDTSDTPDPDNPGQVAAGLDTGEGLLFEGRPVTAAQSRELTARQFDQLTDFQIAQVAKDVAEGKATLQPQVFSESTAFKEAQDAINPLGFPDLGKAITQSLLANRGLGLEGKLGGLPPATIALLPPSPTGLFGGLFGNAEGGPIVASERLNAGGPVQHFSDGQEVGENWGNVDETDFSIDPSSPNVASAPNVTVETSPSVGWGNIDPTDPNQVDPFANTNQAQGQAMTDFITGNISIPGTNTSLPFSPLDAFKSYMTKAHPALSVIATAPQVMQAFYNQQQGLGHLNSGIIGGIVESLTDYFDVQPGTVTFEDATFDDPTDFSNDPNAITQALSPRPTGT